MKFERPNSNIVPFGTNANENKRFAFGTNNYTNDINENLNDSFKLGWETVGINSKPPRQWFNGLAYTSTYLISYLFQTGIPEWNENQEYYINSIAKGSDGELYKSLSGTAENPNVGNNPTSSGSSNWKLAAINKIAYNLNTSSFIPNTLSSGAIIERGSNANGEYIKFADGTLIMTAEVTIGTPDSWTGTSGSKYKMVTWNYPHSTASLPFVTVGGGMSALSSNATTIGNVMIASQRRNSSDTSLTSCSIIAREIRVSQETTQVVASVVAISKWK
ncbi:hypothetical protein [Aliarcobacter butzleri]|uniref:hypothetical protein n=1 Tax=Aliarcobacter butzleri TaxID=28197 RepID=UPI0021B6DDFB|nr:hypothetical protein [Aliarcobacter butzleri]MCT7637083.1 hypothetical protein [Aliarcobacter butzleri]